MRCSMREQFTCSALQCVAMACCCEVSWQALSGHERHNRVAIADKMQMHNIDMSSEGLFARVTIAESNLSRDLEC